MKHWRKMFSTQTWGITFCLWTTRKRILCFSCQSNLDFLKDSRTLFVDGTFKSSPKLFRQIFIVYGVNQNNYSPLVFLLLPNKTSETYKEALSLIKNNINPDIIYVDFQTAITRQLLTFGPKWYKGLQIPSRPIMVEINSVIGIVKWF